MPFSLNQGSSLLTVVFIVLLCLTLGLGLLVARSSYTISVGVLVGIIIFILSFVSTEIAIYVLIFATLLSPEFGSRETHGGGVTLRAEDFLLVIIGFSQLARSALHKGLGLFRSTPLNRPIVYYILACTFATGLGIMFGRVKALSGSFFLLKYAEYIRDRFRCKILKILKDRNSKFHLVLCPSQEAGKEARVLPGDGWEQDSNR
ncbi:MAG: hypothetical protein EXS64_12245, partial [Candidatus Latescibacteria bacterium]|nr:hypothetical protein [Candidatus Latescibacterota bacterium]